MGVRCAEKKWKNIITVLLLCLSAHAYAQVNMHYKGQGTNDVPVRNLFDIIFVNTAAPQNVTLNVIVKDSTGSEIIAYRTEPFKLNNGFSQYIYDSVKMASVIYGSPETEHQVEQRSAIPAGHTKLIFTLYDANNTVLARDEAERVITRTPPVDNSRQTGNDQSKIKKPDLKDISSGYTAPNGKFIPVPSVQDMVPDKKSLPANPLEGKSLKQLVKDNVKLDGFVQLHGEDYNTTDPANIYPSPSGYVDANATLTVGVIPITGRAFLSNIPAYYQPTVRSFSVGFDANRFQAALKEKMQKQFNDQAAATIKNTGEKQAITELQNLKKEIAKPVYADRLKDLDKFSKLYDTTGMRKKLQDSIERYEMHKKALLMKKAANEKDSLGKMDTAKQDENRIRYCKALKEKYELLLKQKAEFDKLKTRAADLEKKLEDIKKVRAQSKTMDNGSLHDSKAVQSKLEEEGMLKGPMKYLLSVRKLQAGRIYPSFSPYVMQGYPINGGEIEVTPGIFYADLVKGNSVKYDIHSLFGPQLNGSTDITAVKAGLGSPERTHIHFVYLNGRSYGDVPLSNYATPVANTIMGVQARYNINSIYSLEGEYMQSASQQRATYRVDTFGNRTTTDSNYISTFSTNNKDYEASLKATADLTKISTRISGQVYRIGGNYQSIAVPILMNNLIGYKVKIDKAFFRKKIRISTALNSNADNINGQRAATTYTSSWTNTLDINLKKLPVILITYAPYSYHNNFLTSGFDNYSMHIWFVNMTLMQTYKIDKSLLTTTASYVQQRQTSSIALSDHRVDNWQLNEALTMAIPLQISTSLSYSTQRSPLQDNSIYTADLRASYKTRMKMIISAGGRIMKSTLVNKKQGYFCKVSYPVNLKLIVDVGFESNQWSAPVAEQNSFRDYRIASNIKYVF